ncbi:hypothetical protein OSB04_017932 [Centaurea solstitialis]|uniref:Uncharacterized protein n=1 Tax=Centaurea solstitialis TaxID=347529 RepID=A0AA38TLW5_9ASTR|nr:hypothetical protein OSB04_017932 [Centaurea solstitialis]
MINFIRSSDIHNRRSTSAIVNNGANSKLAGNARGNHGRNDPSTIECCRNTDECRESMQELAEDLSSKLNRLCVTDCYKITGRGLNNALKRLPHLETLELSYIRVSAKDIEAIGRNCPRLKSFKMMTYLMDCHGVRAILNSCPNLESLHMLDCFYTRLDENLEKLCRERIKDFKFNRDNIPEGDEDCDMGFTVYDMNDFYDGRGMHLSDDDALGDYGVSGGSDISGGDDFD